MQRAAKFSMSTNDTERDEARRKSDEAKRGTYGEDVDTGTPYEHPPVKV